MLIKILGTGCANCTKLEANTRAALVALSCKAEIVKVTDYGEIAEFGVVRTPGLVVDENVIASGRVLNISEIKDILSELI